MSVPQAYPDPDDVPRDYCGNVVPPTGPLHASHCEPQNGNGFRSGPYPGMYPAATVEESIRLSLLVAAGHIPFPLRYVETEVQP